MIIVDTGAFVTLFDRRDSFHPAARLVQQPKPMYALSDDFSMFMQSKNELYDVLQILKKLGNTIET